MSVKQKESLEIELEDLELKFKKHLNFRELKELLADIHNETKYTISTHYETEKIWGATNPDGSINHQEKINSRRVMGAFQNEYGKSLSFELVRDYDRKKDGRNNIKDDIIYTGMRFDIDIDRIDEKLSSQSTHILKVIKEIIKGYNPQNL